MIKKFRDIVRKLTIRKSSISGDIVMGDKVGLDEEKVLALIRENGVNDSTPRFREIESDKESSDYYLEISKLQKVPIEYLNNKIILEYNGHTNSKNKFVVKFAKNKVGRIDGPSTTSLLFKLWNKSNFEIRINKIIMENVVPFHCCEHWEPLPTRGFSEDNVLRELLFKYRYVDNTTLAPNRYINIIYNFPLLNIEIAKAIYNFRHYFHIDLTIPSKSLDYKYEDITREITKEFFLELEYSKS